MKTKLSVILGVPLVAFGLLLTVGHAFAVQNEDRIVRIAEIEVDPDQVEAYKAALTEEIAASIRLEPGVLTLYAVSVKGHPEQVRLFEIYRDTASYQAHLQSLHFKKYKEQTQKMVRSLTLVETEPILLGSKFK